MVDWNDPEIISRTRSLLEQSIAFLLGFYGWHFLLSLHVEWSLLTRKLSFKWPLVPYLLGRYSMLCVLLYAVIMTQVHVNERHCRAAFDALSVIGCIAVCCASMNLSIRTLVIWSCSLPMRVVLITLSLGHWTFALFVSFAGIRTYYDPSLSICVILTTGRIDRLAGFFAYTVCYDFIILVLTVYGLYRTCKRSELFSVICVQGIWYFVLTLLVNIPSAALARAELNVIMNVFLSFPAATISVIASSRAVLAILSMEDLRGPRESQSKQGPSWLRRFRQPQDEPDLLTTHVTLTPSSPDVVLSVSDVDVESRAAAPAALRSLPSASDV